MQEKEQDYAKNTFNEIATKYDEIEFFKISARYVADIIKEHKADAPLDILDVACGTGNVVLECALCLKNATFDAMDISEGMLNKAKENAKKQNIDNVNFYLEDIMKLSTEKRYDVITCSYALFFLPNAVGVLEMLVSKLKEDGILIFTSFLEKAFTPTGTILLSLLEKHGSNSAKEYDGDAWEKLKKVADIEYLCKEANVSNFDIRQKKIRYGLSLDGWWELLNNTGFKGMLMELSSENYELLKLEFYEAMLEYIDEKEEVELNADTYFVVVSRR